MKMTLSHQYLSVNLDILDKLGFPKEKALEVMGLDETALAASHDRMSLDRFQACLAAAAKFTSDSNIGLRLGHKFRVGTFGTTGSLYSYCENLKQVMEMNNLYQKVAIDAGQIEYIQDADGGHHLCFHPYYSDQTRYRQITDMIMASCVTAYRWLAWGSGEDIICAQLPYAPPDQISTYVDILQTRVEFASDRISLQFPDAAVTQKITTRNPEFLARARITLDNILGEQRNSFSFETAVDTAIRGAIETGQVTSQIIADRMGLSAPALRSQLNDTGRGVRERLDKVRKSLFIEKFNAGHTFAQIAVDLAYNDQPAMNRAFRRWHGMTPTQWRDKNHPPLSND